MTPGAVSTRGAGARAIEAATRAVQQAKRASNALYCDGLSTRAPPVDFTSLGLLGWNRYGAQSLFQLADGGV
eukprot:3340177-Pleurochrysis_carterae.AAC.1